jgi:hypothetical protein
MYREVRTWRLFALTWTGTGFVISESLPTRLQGHERTVARFALRLGDLYPDHSSVAAPDVDEARVLEEWLSIKLAHGELSVAFFREADAYALEMRERSGNWGTFTAGLR